jgi:hypothetical protein
VDLTLRECYSYGLAEVSTGSMEHKKKNSKEESRAKKGKKERRKEKERNEGRKGRKK